MNRTFDQIAKDRTGIDTAGVSAALAALDGEA